MALASIIVPNYNGVRHFLELFDARVDFGIIDRTDIDALLAAWLALILGSVEVPVATATALHADEAAIERELRGEGRIEAALRQFRVEHLVDGIDSLHLLLPLSRNW